MMHRARGSTRAQQPQTPTLCTTRELQLIDQSSTLRCSPRFPSVYEARSWAFRVYVCDLYRAQRYGGNMLVVCVAAVQQPLCVRSS